MMIVPAGVKVHLVLGITDMRKGMDGLATLVQETLNKDPFSGHLFAFRGRSTLAEAVRYALSRWDGLTRFLKDGRIELDTNPVERAIRPVALGRKNHLFAGSDRGGARWATVCSLIETAKMNGVEPYAYLKDVLQRMVDGHAVNRLDELLPWTWKADNAVKT